MQALRRRKETLNKTKIGMNAAAETEGEYWDDNDLAYTFENGGILPDLAYLDNNEVVRDDSGNIVQVPNTQPGTDNHLVDASTLESVLSDKIKRPGTNRTFAKEGQILSKMTKPSKGKDIFAENTNRLNKINANKAYNKLLAEQEAVKAAKGVKPKIKGIPAYEDGTNNRKLRWGIWNVEDVNLPDLNVLDRLFTRDAKDISDPDATVTKGRAGIYDVKPVRYNRNAAHNTALQMGSPTTGTWFAPLQTTVATPQQVDAITYANDEPISVDIPLLPIESEPTVTNTYTNASNKQVTKTPSTTGSVTTKKTTKPNITKTTTQRLSEPTMPLVNTSMAIDWEDVVTPVNIPTSADEATKKRVLGKPKSGYSPDWLSLAPTVYNTLQSLRGPEEEPLVLNPYAGAVRSTMARRRMNIEPARLANSRSRAISNYNLANINANTGANLAARTQAAVDEYASNANMYATKQNADNAYLGEYANTLNNLGQQFVQSENMYNDLNARNRAAARNFGATATSQLGKWSQVNRLMQNQSSRDQMTLPFLADFLSQGFTKEQVDNLLTRTRNRV